jgi:hypothetical protein
MATYKFYQDKIEQQVNSLLGLKQETIGKTQVRQSFLPLIDELDQTAKAVKITDHEEPVAILIGYEHWSAVISKLSGFIKPISPKPKIELMGSVKIIGDLQAGSKKIAKEFRKAINKSGKKLREELR